MKTFKLSEATSLYSDNDGHYKFDNGKFYHQIDGIWVETHPQIGCDWQIALLKKTEKRYYEAIEYGLPMTTTYEYDKWGEEEFTIDMFFKCICGKYINHARIIDGDEEDMEIWEDNKWGEEEFIGNDYMCPRCKKKYIIYSSPDNNPYENAVAFLNVPENKNLYEEDSGIL